MDYRDINDFGRFAKDKGISGMNLHYFNQKVEKHDANDVAESGLINHELLDLVGTVFHTGNDDGRT